MRFNLNKKLNSEQMFTDAQMNTRPQIDVNETQSQQGVGGVARRDPCHTYISYTSL